MTRPVGGSSDRGEIETGDLRAALFTGADIGAKLGERNSWKLVVIVVLCTWLFFLTGMVLYIAKVYQEKWDTQTRIDARQDREIGDHQHE